MENPLSLHRTTVKNEPIHTISYKLYPYMPHGLVVILDPPFLLLLRCILSYVFSAFPFRAMVNIIFCSGRIHSQNMFTVDIFDKFIFKMT